MKEPRSKTKKVVGPGSYEANTQYMPLYKLKPSSNFASSTQRTLAGFGIKPLSSKMQKRDKRVMTGGA